MAALSLFQAFNILNQWLSTLQAQKQALEWLMARSEEKHLIESRLNHLKPALADASMAWMNFLKKGESSASPALMQKCSEYLMALAEEADREAEELEPLLARRGESFRKEEALKLFHALFRTHWREEHWHKGAAALARDRNSPGPQKAGQARVHRIELRQHTLHRMESLLDKPDLDSWDARNIRTQAAALPALLRHEAMELRLLASDAVEGPPHLTAEAQEAWTAAGIEPMRGPAWLSAGFTPEEAGAWAKAKLAEPLDALEWSARGKAAEEAAAWVNAGFNPESADNWLGAGATSLEEAVTLKKEFLDPDSLRLWVRAGISPAEAMEFKHKGVKSPLQAHALKNAPAEAAARAEAPAASPEPAHPKAAAAEAGPPPLKGLEKAVAQAGGPGLWSEAGVPPEKAALWEAAFFTPQQALPWIDRGFSSKDALAWQEAGILHPEKAKAWIEAGAAAPDLAHWLERRLGHAHVDPGASPTAEALALPCPNEPFAYFAFGRDANPGDPSRWVKQALSSMGSEDLKKNSSVVARLPGDAATHALAQLGTEHWATFSLPMDIRSPDLLAEWAQGLSKLEAALSLPHADPSFLFRNAGPQAPDGARAAIFYGAAFSEVEGPPWMNSMDFLPSENWLKRWWRKTDDWGEPGKAPPARIGVFGEKGKIRYLAALEETLHIAAPGEWASLKKLDIKGAWRDEWEDFSRVMDLPLRKPRWMLALAFFGEKPAPPAAPEEGA